MIEGYIIKIERCFRYDGEYVFITSDTVYSNHSTAMEESRKLYNDFCKQIEKEIKDEYSLDELQEDIFDDKRFCDDGAFFIRDIYGYYANGYIEKINIDLDDKQLKKDNNV